MAEGISGSSNDTLKKQPLNRERHSRGICNALNLKTASHYMFMSYCSQRPLRNRSIDGLSSEVPGMSFFRISFLREISLKMNGGGSI